MKNTTTKQDVNTTSRLGYFNQFNLVEPLSFHCLLLLLKLPLPGARLPWFHLVWGNKWRPWVIGWRWWSLWYYDGRWVWDDNYPLYESPDCPFIDSGFRFLENGRPDSFYTKWRWQPKACNLPRFNATKILEKLRNRRIAFIVTQ